MNHTYTIKIKDMSLSQIAESGQVFRMNKEGDGYRVWKAKDTVLVKEKNGRFTFDCTKEVFHKLWFDYFDISEDYSSIKSLVENEDAYLKKAIKEGSGIRILKQDLWEMMVSFIISQNNNIPRIKNSIEKICTTTKDGGFPTPVELSRIPVETLRSFGLGYRDEYISSLARAVSEGRFDIEALKTMDYEEARRSLVTIKGIGKKVADCICVFGLHHLDAFPIDTHVKRILREHYPSGFPFERYRGYAAVMQQYMFYYEIRKK